MKPSQLLVATAGAIALSACGGTISTSKQPAWVDPPLCQKTLPALEAYQQGEPIGGEGLVTIAVRAEDKSVNVYVVNAMLGKIERAIAFDPNDWKIVLDLWGDRIAPSMVMPPPPPPPPIGNPKHRWDHPPAVLARSSMQASASLASKTAMPAPSAAAPTSSAEEQQGVRYLMTLSSNLTQTAPMKCQ